MHPVVKYVVLKGRYFPEPEPQYQVRGKPSGDVKATGMEREGGSGSVLCLEVKEGTREVRSERLLLLLSSH